MDEIKELQKIIDDQENEIQELRGKIKMWQKTIEQLKESLTIVEEEMTTEW